MKSFLFFFFYIVSFIVPHLWNPWIEISHFRKKRKVGQTSSSLVQWNGSCISLKSEEQNKNSLYSLYIYINYFQGKFVYNDFYIGDKSRFYSRQPSSWKSLGNGLFIFIAAIDMRAWSVALKFFLPDETRETLPKEYKETEHKTFPPSNLDYVHDLVKKLCKKIFQISKTLSPRSFSMLRSKRS